MYFFFHSGGPINDLKPPPNVAACENKRVDDALLPTTRRQSPHTTPRMTTRLPITPERTMDTQPTVRMTSDRRAWAQIRRGDEDQNTRNLEFL